MIIGTTPSADARRVPYEPTPVEPTNAAFWRAVSEILTTGVRLDLPKPMDPMDEPEAEIEFLFEAVCQGGRTMRLNHKASPLAQRH